MAKVAAALVVAVVGAGAAAVATAEDPPAQTVTVAETYQGKGIRWWAKRTVQARRDANRRGRTIRRLKRTLRSSPTIVEAISLASVVYRVDRGMLLRKAMCESGLWPYARNRSSDASGLFQFLPSTFASTPFASFSIWNPYANALAAGWMHANGRGGEWVCR